MMRRIQKAVLVLAVMLLPAVALASPAGRDAIAEKFISERANIALGILNDKTASLPEKAKLFRGFVDETADVERITGFVLGKYRRQLTTEQMSEFSYLFRQYAINTYEKRLTEYGGERLRVIGSSVRKPGDVVVMTRIEGGDLDKPQPVKWRVLRQGDSWRVVDVEVLGVWLAITQQQEFVTLLDNSGGKPDVLMKELRGRLAADSSAPRTKARALGKSQ